MTHAEQILVVDRADGAFQGVLDELDLLGLRVVWVPTLQAALDFIQASSRVALVIASSAVTVDGGQEFLARVKDLRPSLPIIWGRSAQSVSGNPRGLAPDSLLSEPPESDALRSAVASLLAEVFYPKPIADAVRASALEVLSTLGEFRLDGSAFLVANRSALADFSAIIAFSGSINGHLLTSMTTEHVNALHRRFLPRARPASIDQLEDLVGELCNRILGRINAFFAQYAVPVRQTTPIFIRAAGSTMRYPGRHPSFALQLTNREARVSLEYYLADFDRSRLGERSPSAALHMGEILYF
jgi:CheY-specific phosphatase CheX